MELLFSTWSSVERYLGRSKGVVIPLGSIEQHGPGGLIGTDALCAEAIARRIGAAGDILVGPTIPFGVAPFNLAFPGTISMRASTLMALVDDYLHSLMRHGFERFYFLNGHGGNLGALRAACQDLQASRSYATSAESGTARFKFRSWWDYPTVDALRRDLYGDGEGMHATPSEIAITQFLYPERIQPLPLAPPAKLSAAFLRDHAGDNHAGAEEHRRAFPDGRVGSDSGLARPEHGERLLAAAVQDGLEDYRAFLIEP
ncbi:MAG: amidase [Rhizobiales bacterium 65-9]|nr:MAG: amidase [Rhizobiales bacterium 65-9]